MVQTGGTLGTVVKSHGRGMFLQYLVIGKLVNVEWWNIHTHTCLNVPWVSMCIDLAVVRSDRCDLWSSWSQSYGPADTSFWRLVHILQINRSCLESAEPWCFRYSLVSGKTILVDLVSFVQIRCSLDDVEVATDRPCHCRTFQPQISKNVVALGTVPTLFSMTILCRAGPFHGL